LRHIVQGQLPEFVFRPGLFLLLITAALLLAVPLTAASAMMLRVTVDCAVLFGALWLLFRQPQSRRAIQTQPQYQHRAWLGSTLPLAFAAGMLVINQQIGIIILGLFEPPEIIGT